MTLAELLSASMIGGIVLTAAGILVVISITSSQRVSDKVNAVSQGRLLATQLEQRINSQVCLYAGEYAINGSTVYTGAADSIAFASTERLVFFADINRNGATGSTTSVGFRPYLRFLKWDAGPTSGTNAGRKGTFMDGYREPTNSAIPFNYSLLPLSATNALDTFGAPANANQVQPTTERKIVEGVTSDVTGVTNAPIPFFEYWNTADQPITMSAGAVPQAELPNIGHIRVNFRMLADSGRDSAARNTQTKKLDDRTASFNTDVYLRTNPSICG